MTPKKSYCCIKPRPNARNMLRVDFQHVACCWLKFFKQHFECCMMMYSFGHVRATLLRRSMRTSSVCAIQHVATGWPNVFNMLGHVVPNNVAICCVEMLRAFGQLLHNILQHDPTLLRYVGLKCCVRLASSFGTSHNMTQQCCHMLG